MFKQTLKLLQALFKGKTTIEDIRVKSGADMANITRMVADEIASEHNQVHSFEIAGALAHNSADDAPGAPKHITLAVFDQQNRRIATTHVEENGRYYSQKSRFGFEIGSGQVALVAKGKDDERTDSKNGK